MIFYGTSFTRANFTDKYDESLATVYFFSQMGPIYFWYPIPSKISVNDRIDLSFSKSTLITMFRYKLEIPGRGETSMYKSIIVWSAWSSDDVARIIIPRLDIEGSYKLVIEYKTKTSSEAKKVEKLFSVHPENPIAGGVISKSKTAAVDNKTVAKTAPSADKTTMKTNTVTNKTATITTPVTDKTVKKTTTETDKTEKKTASVTDRTPTKKPTIADIESPETTTATDRTAAKTTPLNDRVESKTTLVIDKTKAKPVNMISRNSRKKTPVINKIPVNTMSIKILSVNDASLGKELKNYIKTTLENVETTEEIAARTTEKVTPVIQKIEIKMAAFNILPSDSKSKLKEIIKFGPPILQSVLNTEILDDTEEGRTEPLIDKIPINPSTVIIPTAFNINIGRELIEYKPTYFNHPDTIEDSTAMELPSAGILSNEPSLESIASENSNAPDYTKLLATAIETRDAELIRKSIQNGAGIEIKGAEGGNIFHIIDDTLGNEDLISLLIKNGISIDETDNYGNTPLHVAILSGESNYARSLINKGAKMNIKNKSELTPLHLAALLNNGEIANYMLIKGAEINIRGNSGYTPLHIASEMNHIAIANDLLNKKANNKEKTDQGLTPGAIAKIQNNYEMNKLISKKYTFALNQPKSILINSPVLLTSVKLSPKYEFNLPYDKELVRKRQFSKVVRIISIPVFALSSAGVTFLKSEANHNYSLSKTAETEEMAKVYYDKTTKLDRYTYISGGISLITAYSFIHSTIRKKNISNKMRKIFN
jgi:hypothetical protein